MQRAFSTLRPGVSLLGAALAFGCASTIGADFDTYTVEKPHGSSHGAGGTSASGAGGSGAEAGVGGRLAAGGAPGSGGRVGAGGRFGAGGGFASGGAIAGDGGAAGTCGPEVCDGLDNDCDSVIDGPAVCNPACVGASFQGGAYMVCSTLRTWQDAESDCATKGMHLVRIDSTEENAWLTTVVSANSLGTIWIGATDRREEGAWRWLGDAAPFWTGGPNGVPGQVFTNWSAGEPNDALAKGEDCGEFFLNNSQWNDTVCDRTWKYVCELYGAASGCFDAVRNGGETGIDCGGACARCPAGEGCAANGDCSTLVCASGTCADTCTDGLRSPAETDVDCGGPCPRCASSLGCALDGDCATRVCSAGICAACTAAPCPSCGPGAKCCTTAGVCGCAANVLVTCK